MLNPDQFKYAEAFADEEVAKGISSAAARARAIKGWLTRKRGGGPTVSQRNRKSMADSNKRMTPTLVRGGELASVKDWEHTKAHMIEVTGETKTRVHGRPIGRKGVGGSYPKSVVDRTISTGHKNDLSWDKKKADTASKLKYEEWKSDPSRKKGKTETPDEKRARQLARAKKMAPSKDQMAETARSEQAGETPDEKRVRQLARAKRLAPSKDQMAATVRRDLGYDEPAKKKPAKKKLTDAQLASKKRAKMANDAWTQARGQGKGLFGR